MQGFQSPSLSTTIATAAGVSGADEATRLKLPRLVAMTSRNKVRRGSTCCPSMSVLPAMSPSAARTFLLWIVVRAHVFWFGRLTDFSGGAQKTTRISSSEMS
jgi:hypothetical protein